MRQYIPDRCSRHTCLSTDNRPGTCTTHCTQRAYREDHCERDYLEGDEQNPSDREEPGVHGGDGA